MDDLIARKRDPLATILLVLLYVGYVLSFAVSAYYAFSGHLQLVPFDGPFGWVLRALLLLMFLWSLESIRRWNRLGFALYVMCCAISFALDVYAWLMGFPIASSRLLGPIVSPFVLWIVLQLGSPGAWQQMGSHDLFRDLQPSKIRATGHEPVNQLSPT